MIRPSILPTLLILAGLLTPLSAQAGQRSLKAHVHIQSDLDYLLYTPDGYETSQQLYPLVVWLHGGNEGGNDIERVRSSGLPKMIEEGRKFPFLVFSPQNPSEELLYPIERLEGALEQVLASHRVDRGRVYVMGYSRGGFGAWAMAEQYPDRFAAVVSIAGGANLYYLNRTNEKAASWIFHGTNDDVIPLSASSSLHERLRSLKRNTRLTAYENVDHAMIESIALHDESLWDWLLNQHL